MTALPSCSHCKQQWTYKDTLKNSFRLRCPYCGKRNYFSREFRWREPLFFILVMLINFFLLPMLAIPFLYKTFIILSILFLYILVSPFGLKLNEKEEPYF